ncbi:MAG: glycosyltransferase family 4 protein [Anaerolineaceae bacterium]|nr:glycosyltransferase family 4 protein [Anaerolineaceae bacterium]
MKICFVHDWLTTFGGAEQVLKALLEIWPQTPVYTLVTNEKGNCRSIIDSTEVNRSFVNKMPFAKRKHQAYLPLMPLAIEQFDLSDYNLIISDSHAIAKGVLTGPDQLHISYIHTPIRYAWDMQGAYLQQTGLNHGLRGLLAKSLLHYIRLWDLRTVPGVDQFIANSKYIARRIMKVYKRESTVIHPPVDIERFSVSAEKSDYYLALSRLVQYKKTDLIVQAFTQMPDKKLIVIGDGQQMKSLKRIATGNIEFLGFQPDSAVEDYLKHAKALIYAAEEDFGIVPVEAQACGTPVIAFGKGGALETIIHGETGFFFDRQEPDALVQAITDFEAHPALSPEKIRQNAERFSKSRFKTEMQSFIETAYDRYFKFRDQNG